MKVKQFGEDILEIIDSYCSNHDLERGSIEIPVKESRKKQDTKQVSLDLFRSGKSISEIAADRSLTTGTIESHLGNFIIAGEISVFDIVAKIKVARIMAYIVQNPGKSTTETKNDLGDSISYAELKAVMNHLQYIQNQES